MEGSIDMWKTIYFYIHSIAQQDNFLKKVTPLLQSYDKKWFFIKYWYGGPHLRFRFLNPSKSFLKKFELEMDNFSRTSQVLEISKKGFYSKINFEKENVNSDNLPWYDHGTWFYTQYKPEVERYGEGKALELSETIFYKSSQLALEVINSTSIFSRRLVIASLIMYELLESTNCLTEDFLLSYMNYWKSYDRESNLDISKLTPIIETELKNRSIIEIKKYISNVLPIWKEIVQILGKRAATYVISSQIHMTNNRISVVPAVEYKITKLLLEVFRAK